MSVVASRPLGAAILAAASLLTTSPAVGEQVLQRGEVLGLTILGAPELSRTATVDLNGHVEFPLLGSVRAAGMTAQDLRLSIAEALNEQAFRTRSAAGEDSWRTIQADEVMLEVVQHLPVYVTGDVDQPGVVSFQPGMSVRQAVAAAGGLAILRMSAERHEVVQLQLGAERGVLLREIMAERTALSALDAERKVLEATLAGETGAQFDPSPAATALTPAELRSAVVAVAEARLRQVARELELSEEVLAQRADRLKILHNQNAQENERLTFDTGELARLEELAQRGTVPRNVVSDARRDLLFSATQALQTSAEIARLQTENAEFAANAERAARDAHIAALNSIEARTARVGVLTARLEMIEESLATLGEGARAGRLAAFEPEVMLFPSGAAGVAASMETVLTPGDVMDVRLPARISIFGQ